MKYRLSLLIGCLAVLLGVFTFAACDKKDKNNNPESGYSIVGKWVQVEYDSYYGTTTTTIQFNSNHSGTYSYMYDGEYYPQSFMYTYDPETCTGTMLMYNIEYGVQIESAFKLTWYDENTVSVSVYDEDYGEWEALGVFKREGASPTPSGDTYSIIGTWKHSEYSEYYGTQTTIIRFNANGTGTMTYSSREGSDTYNLSYSYNQTTCIGSIMMIYTEPGYGTYYYPMDFKIKWYGANTALIYTRDEEYAEYGWEEMGVFERQ